MEAIIVKHDEGQAGFIRYTILITLREQSWSIVRRFNDFTPLHEALCRSFPRFPGRLPVKKWFGRFNADFLRERRVQLQHYLDAVTSLPGFPESSREGRIFFEVDRHLGGQETGDRAHQDGGAVEDTTPYEEARISAILDDTSHAFINTSSPLHQVSIEQMDPAELAQQRSKLLQRILGFRGHSSTVQKLSCASHLQQQQHQHNHHHHHSNQQPQQRGHPGGGGGGAGGGSGGGGGVIDVLAAPSRMTLGAQAQLLEKQGLCVADELREARQIRTKDDKDLICRLRDERV